MEGEEIYRGRWRILAVLCLSVVIVQLDNLILNVALPAIQRDLGASSNELQWMVPTWKPCSPHCQSAEHSSKSWNVMLPGAA